LVPRLAARGGGPLALDVRVLAKAGPDGGVLVAHLHVDCRDAMGANLVNTLCEALADRVAAIADGQPGLRILSNLTDGRTVTVRTRIEDAQLSAEGIGAEVRAAIAAASRFAELDPYRATTHNKGIMNGVDAVLVATGQDWRAVEAGAHAFAARSGAYRPLAVWRERPGGLDGELALPMAVGTVRGAPHARPRRRARGRPARRDRRRRRPGHQPRRAARARDRGYPARPHGAPRPRPGPRRRRDRRADRPGRRRARRHRRGQGRPCPR